MVGCCLAGSGIHEVVPDHQSAADGTVTARPGKARSRRLHGQGQQPGAERWDSQRKAQAAIHGLARHSLWPPGPAWKTIFRAIEGLIRELDPGLGAGALQM